ncbi:MAG: helix-turn-helix transcriptional regulator [Candidatus Cryptobacteroides sp.]
MDNNSIKENISRRRKELGLSQSDVAEKIGLSRNSYRNIEKGTTRLISDVATLIADALDTTLEDLLLGSTPYEERNLMHLGETYEEYPAILDSKEQTIRSLKELLDSKDEIIRYQDEMIKMLKKIVSEK